MTARRIAFPFLTLSDAAMTVSAWKLSLDGINWRTSEDHLENWDPTTRILATRKIRVDPDIAAKDLALNKDDLELEVSVRIGTGAGRMPAKIIERKRFMIYAGRWSEEIELDIPGSMLSSVLDILTEISLGAIPEFPGILSPKRAGDRVWSDPLRLRLEGEDPRFPIEAADFTQIFGTSGSASAPWYLHWSPSDWQRDFHGAVRLYLNQANDGFRTRIEEGDAQTLQAMMADVMGQICERLLMEHGTEDYFRTAEEGTLAGQAIKWLKKSWPGRDANFIRSVLETQSGKFRAAMFALAEV